MKKLLIIFLFLFIQNSTAQYNKSIDSLNLVLQKEHEPKHKVEVLLSLTKIYKEGFDYKNALTYAEKTFKLSQQHNFQTYILKSYLELSVINKRLSNFDEALVYVNKSIQLAKDINETILLVEAYNYKAGLFTQIGYINESLDLYYDALKIAEKINDNKGIGSSFGGIAYIYFMQKNYIKAQTYYLKSLKKFKDINYDYGINICLNNIASTYRENNEHEKAIPFLTEVISRSDEQNDFLQVIYLNLAEVYCDIDKSDEALPYIKKAIIISNTSKHPESMAFAKITLAYYYLVTNNLKKSLENSLSAYDIGVKNNLLHVSLEALESLSNIYKITDSIKHMEVKLLKYELNDKIAINESSIKISNLETRYHYETEKLKNESSVRKKNYMFIISITSLIIVLLLVLTILFSQKIKITRNKLKRSELKYEIEVNGRELTTDALSRLRKNEILMNVSTMLQSLKTLKEHSNIIHNIEKIEKVLHSSINNQIWKEFEVRFQKVHSGFYNKLMIKFPNLTSNEKKLCAFLRLNMSSKDISELTGQSVQALEMARHRLRKKLEISNTKINLITFISKI